MLKKLTEAVKKRPIIGWLIFVVVMVVVFCIGILAASITERRSEIATLYHNKKVDIKGINPHNEQWGENYPREYNTWKKTKDMDFRSKYLGNKPHDELADHPEMVILWAGYAFSMAYDEPRGHMHAIEDVTKTLRTGCPSNGKGDLQPGTCWTCKSPDVPRMMSEVGISNFYKAKWSQWGNEIVNPIGCADCHDPKTMSLTITRPALIEAFHRQGRDVTKATPQEMRSLVCAQCHVEYSFLGKDKYLTFPWDKGMTVEAMEQFYDSLKFSDFTNKLSRVPILKAQHPDYELSLMGTHAQHGVTCADCHMPYKVEGGIKYTDHQIVSPLKNISATCQTCHHESEEKLRNYVYQNQDKIMELRRRVEPELAKAHIMAKTAWDNGATETEMKIAIQLIRQAQWRWDFAVASHGAPFHAPLESARILTHSLDKTMQAQLALQQILFEHGVKNFTMPDISTKEKAQKYIGLDMATIEKNKETWLKTVPPQWLQEAKKEGRVNAAI